MMYPSLISRYGVREAPFLHCVKEGTCFICLRKLEMYDSKFHHTDGRMCCSEHGHSAEDYAHLVKQEFYYYTDG